MHEAEEKAAEEKLAKMAAEMPTSPSNKLVQ
jgi:hypothetical protein